MDKFKSRIRAANPILVESGFRLETLNKGLAMKEVFMSTTPHEWALLVLGGLAGPVLILFFRFIKGFTRFTFSYPNNDLDSFFRMTLAPIAGASFAILAAREDVDGLNVAGMILDSWLMYWCLTGQWRHIMKKIENKNLQRQLNSEKRDDATP